MKFRLAVEDFEDTLTEYGRAMAYFNFVETMVNNLLIVGGMHADTFGNAVYDNGEEIGFAGKVALLKGSVPKTIVAKLFNLNNDRVVIAHGVSVIGADKLPAIIHKKTNTALENVLKRMLVSCRQLSEDLLSGINGKRSK